MKKLSFAALLFFLVVSFQSCGKVQRYGKKDERKINEPTGEASPSSGKSETEIPRKNGQDLEMIDEPLRVGIILPLSGDLSSFGQAVLEGILIAKDEFLNDRHIRIEFELIDNAENYRTGSIKSIEIAQRLRDRQVSAVIGPLTTPSVVSTALTLAADSILVLSPTSSAYDLPGVSVNAFSLSTPSPSLSRRIASFAVRDLGLSTFAVLYPDNLNGHIMARAFIDEIEALGETVVIAVAFPTTGKTYENEIKTIALYHPEAVYIPARSEDVIQIAPQIPYYSIYDAVLLGADGWNYDDITRKGGTYVEGVYFSDSYFPESAELIHEKFAGPYIEIHRKEPNRIAGWGYDTLAMIVQAYEQGGSRPAELLEAFLQTSDFRGATAIYSMVDGRLERKAFLFTISGGEIVTLESVPADSISPDLIESQGGVHHDNGG